MPRFPDLPGPDGVVVLRAWEDRDLEFLVAACNDPLVARFSDVPQPYTRADARAWITSARWLLDLGREAHLALADATVPGRPPLGAAGLVRMDRAARRGEIGYWLAPDARGRGLAPRAVRLVADWALGAAALSRVVMRVHPDNVPSQRVAAAAGFVRSVETEPGGLLLFGRSATAGAVDPPLPSGG